MTATGLYVQHPTDPNLRVLVTQTDDGIRVEVRRVTPTPQIEIVEDSYEVIGLPFHVVLDRVYNTMMAQS